ncbi:hypothetical protein MIMGU_mgv1a015801mg [Erythranthe guttata]|uniref:Uncharacterized protein n=1 Tax=Erythranthe guttata TaxID=4155 RepID=A0A022QSL0_ERYGU|nr:hypothetical protein MIMGU_mgv1a015801mg [Erythranthe guttata]
MTKLPLIKNKAKKTSIPKIRILTFSPKMPRRSCCHLWWRRRHHQPMVEAAAEDHGRHGWRHEFLRHGVQFREHFLQIPHLPLEPLSSIIAAPVNFHLLHVMTAVVAAAARRRLWSTAGDPPPRRCAAHPDSTAPPRPHPHFPPPP